ncbi:MAG: helix-turn-helix domain-containing protein [Lachnospiraceae bacterium]|nr:helix-turn-helix domain-containing protein [Lachnospiraceae bacterium]
MGNHSLGDTIRSLRKKAGLSQEKLAEGICSPVSISRIENGVQMPSSTVLDRLLAKLGTSTYQICEIYYKNEEQQRFEEEAKKISRFIYEEKIDKAKSLLSCLENSAKANNLNFQHYLLLEASIKFYEGENPHEILSILYEALGKTKKAFDFEDFRHVLLSLIEANILNIFVVTFYRLGQITKAIRLGEELMSSLKRHKGGFAEYKILQINLALNLSQILEKEHRYQEPFLYIEMAEELSFLSLQQSLLPEIEFVKAKLYHSLGKDEECIPILKAVLPYMKLIHKKDFAHLVRKYAKKELGLNL